MGRRRVGAAYESRCEKVKVRGQKTFATVNLYLDGKIDQWYSLEDRRGVVFVLNVNDPTVAHEMLEKLPLGQAHLMSFELIPLGPLRRLLGMTPKPQ
jgi:hypothetical protein